jgi:hypothetical protein
LVENPWHEQFDARSNACMKTSTRILLSCSAVLICGATPAVTPPCAIPQGEAAAAPDRVGFPAGYATNLRLLGVQQQEKSPEVMTTYGNDLAAAVTREEQLPFPDGAIIVMEFANAKKDSQGRYLRDAAGQFVKGDLIRVDVMRRGPDFGAMYGESRAGEWEFASYNPDGTTRIPPDKAASCAACHRKVGAGKDFVHRLRSGATAP